MWSPPATDHRLTQLFLRRFVENDLIAPEADRVQLLSHTIAAIVAGALAVTILRSWAFLLDPYAAPATRAIEVIHTESLYAMWAMTVMALVAVYTWDALALDSRDTQILGPLPIARGAIVRAKTSAIVILASAFACAVNLVPALILPVCAIGNIGPGFLQVIALIAAHLASTMGASAFGFTAVLGLRELLQAALGVVRFRRVSLLVQAALLVGLVTTLLLTPALSLSTANGWLESGRRDITVAPPLWFVGVHDLIAGRIWGELPRGPLPQRIMEEEKRFDELYRSRRPFLRQLGRVGIAALLGSVVVAGAAYVWNNRRLPTPTAPRVAARRRANAIAEAAARSIVARPPLVAAGFFFTARVLGRSVQNRFPIAVALAGATAVAAVFLRIAGTAHAPDVSSAPVSLFAIQLLMTAALILGFRHSLRIPADLRGRWLFHLVRPPDLRVYLSGARRAAIAKLVLPLLLALMPLHVLVLGGRIAVLHAGFGFLVALALIDAALLGYRRLPFAASYVPATTVTMYGPIYGLIGLLFVLSVAALERLALGSHPGIYVLFGIAGAALLGVRAVDSWQRREAIDVPLDELVDPPTLRLGLMD